MNFLENGWQKRLETFLKRGRGSPLNIFETFFGLPQTYELPDTIKIKTLKFIPHLIKIHPLLLADYHLIYRHKFACIGGTCEGWSSNDIFAVI